MILQIPLTAVANQTVSMQLDGQLCRVTVYEKATGLFVDLYVNDSVLIAGVIGENFNPMVRSAYLGFRGDLYFWDSQGESDPDYSGLADRYLLLWDSAL